MSDGTEKTVRMMMVITMMTTKLLIVVLGSENKGGLRRGQSISVKMKSTSVKLRLREGEY